MAEKFVFAEEIIELNQLIQLFKKKNHPVVYNGFEPSGQCHIGTAFITALNVNTMLDAGCDVIILLADVFAQMNGKFEGNMKKINDCGKYMIEVWKACGMRISEVRFLWSSQIINLDYWNQVMEMSKHFTINHIIKCGPIMGRKEAKDGGCNQILYPLMQAADIKFLGADIVQMGMDQRKVNMLYRDYCTATNSPKPVIVSHHLLLGLKKDSEKMSKSDPESALYVTDTVDDIQRKIKKAFCAPNDVDKNPIVDLFIHLVFRINANVTINNIVYHDINIFKKDIHDGILLPDHLKPSILKYLEQILYPVRKHFTDNEEAKMLLDLIRSY